MPRSIDHMDFENVGVTLLVKMQVGQAVRTQGSVVVGQEPSSDLYSC
jgi:hypothetical protein